MFKESTRRFCHQCQIEPINLKFHIRGFGSSNKSVLTTKLFPDKSFRVYSSIFPKISISLLDLEIQYIQVIKFQQVVLTIEKNEENMLDVYTSISKK